MNTSTILSRIFKAALLLVVTSTLSFGQNKMMYGAKKKSNKRVYHCKHVGLQKIEVKKFKKKEVANYVNSKNVDKVLKFTDSSDVTIKVYQFDFTAEVRVVEEKMVREYMLPLPKPVYFRFDTDRLTYDDLHQIILAIEHIKQGKSIVIEGHTDSHGSSEYNMILSLKRVNKIKSMMIELGGVNADAISIKYYGEERPAVTNDNDPNRQLNRRVEFIVMQN